MSYPIQDMNPIPNQPYQPSPITQQAPSGTPTAFSISEQKPTISNLIEQAEAKINDSVKGVSLGDMVTIQRAK